MGVEAEVEMTTEAGEVGGVALASNLVHVTWSAKGKPRSTLKRDATTSVPTPSAEPLARVIRPLPEDDNGLTTESYSKLWAESSELRKCLDYCGFSRF